MVFDVLDNQCMQVVSIVSRVTVISFMASEIDRLEALHFRCSLIVLIKLLMSAINSAWSVVSTDALPMMASYFECHRYSC
jgi:fucose permease